MNNEYYGAASTPTEDFLAHYGVKGMKWGVRKAIQRGSDRALRRQYRKAEKKLAKLEKLGANGKKYAKRAARYGIGAAAAGGLAAAGTGGIANASRLAARGGDAMDKYGRELSERFRGKTLGKVGNRIGIAGRAIRRTGNSGANAIETWGKGTHISDAARTGLGKVNTAATGAANRALGVGNQVSAAMGRGTTNARNALKGVSNNTIARIGAGAIGAGLGVAAGRNVYRAATAKKHAAQAAEFRREMNKAFAGTKYANGMPSKKKRRK